MKFLGRKNIEILKRTLRYSIEYKFGLVILFIGILLGLTTNIAKPLVWGKLVAILIIKDTHTINLLLMGLVIISLLELAVNLLQTYLFSYINNGITYKIKTDMYRRIIDLPVSVFDKMSIGEFMSRLNGDAATVSDIITNQLLNAIVNVLKVLVVGIAIFKINSLMAVIILASFPISYIIFYKFGLILKQKSKEIKELNDRYYSFTQQSFLGIKEIKSQGIKTHNHSMFLSISKSLNLKYINMSLTNSLSLLLSGIASATSNILVIVAGIYFIVNNLMAIEYLIAFTSYSSQFSNSLLSITALNSSIQQALVSLERIFEVMDNFYYSGEKFGNLSEASIDGNINFKNINLTYEGKGLILKDLSFKIQKNRKTAIVGRSGSGKTSIFNLLLRFYEPDSGCIEIDNIDIREFSEEKLRSIISIVRQEPHLFNISIRDNLLLVNPSATHSDIVEACKLACIHDYIDTLPHKYDTIIGENGANISLGQKQRIAIARSLLKKSKIILFDEATASLDNESTFSIADTINKISAAHTIVIVAHKLSSIIDADKIIMIDEGILVGEGTHETLIKSNINYRQLFEKEMV